MYTTISIFYVSLIGIITMIQLKRREIESQRPSVTSKLGRTADSFFMSVWDTVRRWISYMNKKTFFVMAQWLAFHILLRVRRVYVEIKHRTLANPHGRHLMNAVRGRGEIRHHGASFYLRRIGEK